MINRPPISGIAVLFIKRYILIYTFFAPLPIGNRKNICNWLYAEYAGKGIEK
jgi:hypothetical protein